MGGSAKGGRVRVEQDSVGARCFQNTERISDHVSVILLLSRLGWRLSFSRGSGQAEERRVGSMQTEAGFKDDAEQELGRLGRTRCRSIASMDAFSSGCAAARPADDKRARTRYRALATTSLSPPGPLPVGWRGCDGQWEERRRRSVTATEVPTHEFANGRVRLWS